MARGVHRVATRHQPPAAGYDRTDQEALKGIVRFLADTRKGINRGARVPIRREGTGDGRDIRHGQAKVLERRCRSSSGGGRGGGGGKQGHGTLRKRIGVAPG